jgi:hypothetical protein
VAQTVKIPKPTAEQDLALSRAGVGSHKLVWDKTARQWIVTKLDKVASADITYDDWKQGTKSYEAATGAGEGATPEIKSKTRALTDPLADTVEKYGLQVVTDPQTGRTELKGFDIDPKTGKRTTVGVPFYLYLDSKNQIQISSDYDSVKSKAIADLKATGQLNNLFQDLYNKKLISKATYNSKNIAAADFNAALLGSIEQYSRTVISNRQFGTTTEAPPFLNFLQGISVPGGEENLPERRFQDISKTELNAFIDNIYLETIGRKPTEEQRASKLKQLDKIVKAGILTTTKKVGGEIQTRQTGGFDEQEQALRLQKQLQSENPLEYERRQAFEFMTELGKIMSGGM